MRYSRSIAAIASFIVATSLLAGCGSGDTSGSGRRTRNAALVNPYVSPVSKVDRPNNESFAWTITSLPTTGPMVNTLHVYGYSTDPSGRISPLPNFGRNGLVSIVLNDVPTKVIIYNHEVAILWTKTQTADGESDSIRYIRLQSGHETVYRKFYDTNGFNFNLAAMYGPNTNIVDVGIREIAGTKLPDGSILENPPQFVALMHFGSTTGDLPFINGFNYRGQVDTSFGYDKSGQEQWIWVRDDFALNQSQSVIDGSELTSFVDPGNLWRTSNDDMIALQGMTSNCHNLTYSNAARKNCLVLLTSMEPRLSGEVGAVDPRSAVLSDSPWGSTHKEASIESSHWVMRGAVNAIRLTMSESTKISDPSTLVWMTTNTNYNSSSYFETRSGSSRKWFTSQNQILSDYSDELGVQFSVFINNDNALSLAACTERYCNTEDGTGTFLYLTDLNEDQAASLINAATSTTSTSTTLEPSTTSTVSAAPADSVADTTSTTLPHISIAPAVAQQISEIEKQLTNPGTNPDPSGVRQTISGDTTPTAVPAPSAASVKRGSKVKLTQLFFVPKGAKASFKSAGGCKVSGTTLSTPKKAATCSVTMRLTQQKVTSTQRTTLIVS